MNPGELRHRITFQKPVEQKGYNSSKDEYTDFVTVWASVEPLTGRQFFAAEAINSEITHKIKMRYRQGITPDMRIKFGTRIFEVVSPPINYQERNIELQLMCKELV